jgi:hypothetical protein
MTFLSCQSNYHTTISVCKVNGVKVDYELENVTVDG